MKLGTIEIARDAPALMRRHDSNPGRCSCRHRHRLQGGQLAAGAYGVVIDMAARLGANGGSDRIGAQRIQIGTYALEPEVSNTMPIGMT